MKFSSGWSGVVLTAEAESDRDHEILKELVLLLRLSGNKVGEGEAITYDKDEGKLSVKKQESK